MKTYRICWLTVCAVLGTAGAGVAFAWSVPRMLVLLACAAVAGGLVTGMFCPKRDPAEMPLPDLIRLVSSYALVSGTAAVAIVGLGALLGAWVWPVVALVAGISPYALRRCGHALRPRRGSAQPVPQSAQGSPETPQLETGSSSARDAVIEPRSMSDTELCTAWRASFTALQRAPSLSHRLRIIEIRREYLDELERRNPHGLTAWLASGARAAGDPTRFVMGGSGGGSPAIDWDGLIHGPDR